MKRQCFPGLTPTPPTPFTRAKVEGYRNTSSLRSLALPRIGIAGPSHGPNSRCADVLTCTCQRVWSGPVSITPKALDVRGAPSAPDLLPSTKCQNINLEDVNLGPIGR